MERSGEEEKAAAPKRPRRCVQSKLSWARVDAAEATDGVQEGSKEGGGKRKKGARSVAGTPQKKMFTDERQLCESPGCKQESCGVKASGGDLNKGEQENVQQNTTVKKGTGGKRSLKLKNNNCEDSSPKGSNQNHSRAKRRLVNETFEARKEVDIQSDIARRPVFDLWLEGKKAAEENARLSAGKQTHPFFTSWKATKTKMESRCFLQYDKGKCGSYPPVHVFDTQMDMAVSLDWRNWSFMERTLLDSNGYYASESAPAIFDGSVQPLKLDTVCREKMHADQLPNKTKGSPAASATSASIFPTGQDSNMRSLSELEVAHANSTVSFLSSCSSYAANLDEGHDSGLLKVRLVSYYQRCSYKPESSLWTSKYQPENAFEVCGNSESVRFLSAWLKSWHERGPRSSNTVIHREDYSIGDDEDSSFDCESDMDEIDNRDSLKNALLITGPVGSGKSAAIYACAKEQGFEIIEVNASDFRNGALVRQKYGEGIESHGLNKWWSVKDSVSGVRNLEYISSQSDVIEVEEFENDTLEMDSQMCDQDRTHTECFIRESSTSQVANKSLILFEDVDIVFDEDRGFTSSILQLAETTKKPIILTSNNKNPTLPQLLDPLILAFDPPSPVELFSHVSMVCGTEKAHVSPKLLQQLVNSCVGDIRRTLLALQFWCQGNASKVDSPSAYQLWSSGVRKLLQLIKERNLECTYSPLQFDIDAAHMVIPKVIPWDFPCKLSEKVEEDIGKAISAAEERFLRVDSNEQDFKSMGTPDFLELGSNIVDTVKTRKNRRLKKKCSSPEEVSAHIDLEDFSDASDFLVTHSHHTVKQRRIAVISSQSDDELPPTGNLATTCMISVERNSHILSVTSPVQISHVQNLSELPVSLIDQPTRENSVINQFEGCETSTSHICDALKLQDVSCVPESSFVSGSENNKDGCLSVVASRNTTVSLADFSMSICDLPGSDYNNEGTDVMEPSKCSGQNVGSACGIHVESVHRNKEPPCAQNEGEELQSSGYQVMDEYSLGDSSKCVVPGEELQSVECSLQVDSVPETWRKLRSCHENLKPYLATNLTNVSLMVKLASGVSDLISDTDVMLSGCKLHLSDILEPRLIPCSEPDTFSWYDDHCEIGSTFFQHGLCLRTNRCAAVGSTLDYQSTTDLGQEMLAASMNIMALGKLLINENSYVGGYLQSSRYDDSLIRELKSDLHNTVLPIVPAKSSMTLKGLAFHEYLSFMSQISKLESSRLSKSMNEKQRRRSRTSRHHLSSGQLPLPPEHAEKLAQSFCFNGAIL